MPSELSASVISEGTDATKPVNRESTTEAPSLPVFDDEVVGTPQMDTGADFFSSIGAIRNSMALDNLIPHQNYARDSSVATAIGSRPSSAASEASRNNTFKMYPSDESDIDRLIAKSLAISTWS